jgi:acyl-CoA dehydrogenase
MNERRELHPPVDLRHAPGVRHGSDDLRQCYLPRVATGDLHVAFGVTEPERA